MKIDANYSWTVKTPSWAQIDVPEERVGEVTLNILGVPSEYPLADAEGKIQFMSGETVVKEYVITIPGCEDIFTKSMSMGLSELIFNYAGEVKTSAGFIETDVYATVVLIKSDNPTLSAFIKTGGNAKDVKEAIVRVTGKRYRLGLTKTAAPKAAAAPKRDPLEDLISRAGSMGINVDIR